MRWIQSSVIFRSGNIMPYKRKSLFYHGWIGVRRRCMRQQHWTWLYVSMHEHSRWYRQHCLSAAYHGLLLWNCPWLSRNSRVVEGIVLSTQVELKWNSLMNWRKPNWATQKEPCKIELFTCAIRAETVLGRWLNSTLASLLLAPPAVDTNTVNYS